MNEDDIFKMSPFEFDQSLNGWRKIAENKEYLKAANLIKKYISLNKNKILNQPANQKRVNLHLMYFHIGQLLAFAGQGHWHEAIEYFNKSFEEGTAWEDWNAYVSATIGFLESNEKRIEEAIKIIGASRIEDKIRGNLGIIKNLKKALQAGTHDYQKAYVMPLDDLA